MPQEREIPIEPAPAADLVLPKPGRLRRTGDVDSVNQYYQTGIGWVLRQRLRWVRDALPLQLGAVLEIGYGSGIFFYELARRCRRLIGIDVHTHAAGIREDLANDGITPELAQASGMALPFRDASFDAVVIVSALEFMSEPIACLRESMRVLRPGGRLVAVTPRVLGWADWIYHQLSGIDAERDFQGGRQRVQAAIADRTLHAERHPRPAPLPRALAPYELVIVERPAVASNGAAG
jgi:ubiquinone/menaquinone biosynthesis C-methylase UbiE